MIKVSGIRVPEGADTEHVRKKTAHMLRIKTEDMQDFRVLKRSVDARKKNEICDVYTVSFDAPDEKNTVRGCGLKNVSLIEETRYEYPISGVSMREHRPVVCGFGPAGIFASLLLSHAGCKPIIYERGCSMEKRASDVEEFFRTGLLNPESNVQFGEGGAGTFSDGKLNTGIKDREGRLRFVLETFVKCGADEDILTSSHPHIGTDRLRKIIPSIRYEIEKLGGEIRFESKVTGISVCDTEKAGKSMQLCGIRTEQGEDITCDSLFLCIGHSARDTFEMLHDTGVDMEVKPFAVGVRAEHERRMIDEAMRQEKASYRLTYHCRDGRGVYSFCMCPGGYVVNASSEEGHLTVNGMSYNARDGINSNAAIVCTVDPADFIEYGNDALSGMRFQRELERRAYEECGGSIPYQTYDDFIKNRPSVSFGTVQPSCKGSFAMGNIRQILPDNICGDIIEAMPAFGKRITGYDRADTLFAGIEARTSSPVRILRDKDLQSINVMGLYPVGEGAGYAGGIMSAAIDGMKCAERYIRGE